jgi:hypothetical protein
MLKERYNKRCCVHSFWILFDVWSDINFFVCFFLNMYWFIAYKMSDSVSLLLPSDFSKVTNEY